MRSVAGLQLSLMAHSVKTRVSFAEVISDIGLSSEQQQGNSMQPLVVQFCEEHE